MSKLFSYIMGYRNRPRAAIFALLVAGLAFSLSFWRGPVKIGDILFAILAALALLIQMFFNDAFLFRFVWFILGAALGMMHAKIKNYPDLAVATSGDANTLSR